MKIVNRDRTIYMRTLDRDSLRIPLMFVLFSNVSSYLGNVVSALATTDAFYRRNERKQSVSLQKNTRVNHNRRCHQLSHSFPPSLLPFFILLNYISVALLYALFVYRFVMQKTSCRFGKRAKSRVQLQNYAEIIAIVCCCSLCTRPDDGQIPSGNNTVPVVLSGLFNKSQIYSFIPRKTQQKVIVCASRCSNLWLLGK